TCVRSWVTYWGGRGARPADERWTWGGADPPPAQTAVPPGPGVPPADVTALVQPAVASVSEAAPASSALMRNPDPGLSCRARADSWLLILWVRMEPPQARPTPRQVTSDSGLPVIHRHDRYPTPQHLKASAVQPLVRQRPAPSQPSQNGKPGCRCPASRPTSMPTTSHRFRRGTPGQHCGLHGSEGCQLRRIVPRGQHKPEEVPMR